jgi:1-acyl-sn-glycerol-3-phosphate acyltransferase
MKLPALGEKVPRRGNSATRFLGRLVLRRLGWRIEGDVPDVPRCVAIVAPHTSNWDFVIGIAALLALGLRGRWLGKHSVFRPPLRRLLRWAGGIPVDRGNPEGVAEQAVASLREVDPFFLALAPEGTRKRVERWKTGFYRIAHGAGVPIWPVSLDYRSRVFRLHPLFSPTGDFEADVARLRQLYTAVMARHPEGYGGEPSD